MKLGIVVVYLVADDDDKRLLELHLSRIEQNTPEPYVIYAAASRLAAPLRLWLARRPNVKICDFSATELRGSLEHSFYLDRLVAAAVGDGATHVSTLHLDSFPIRSGWATELAAKLRGRCVLSGLLRDPRYDCKPLTAFTLFTREFYLAHRPTFLLPPEVLDSPAYHRYAKACPHVADSGLGYGFKIFTENLSWLPLDRSDGDADGSGFGIFGDLLFHLGGAIYWPRTAGAKSPSLSITMTGCLEHLGRLAEAMLSRVVWDRICRAAPWTLRREVGGIVMTARKARLLADPDAFLRHLNSTRAISPG
jgi:hypothetical protein